MQMEFCFPHSNHHIHSEAIWVHAKKNVKFKKKKTHLIEETSQCVSKP